MGNTALRPSPASAMLRAMGEQPERTPNEQPEHLTFAEAAERLGATPDAVRMRAHRGKLATVRVDGRTRVLWPQPEATERPNEPRTEPNGSAVRGNERDVRLVAALEERIGSLERQLAERTEEARRKDHIIAGLIQRLPEPPPALATGQNAPSAQPEAPHATETSRPPSEPLMLRWRRWLRRVVDG